MDLLGKVLHSILHEADRTERELGLQQYRTEVSRKPQRWQEIYFQQLNRLLSKPRFPRRVSWLVKLIHGRGWGRSWYRVEVHAEGISIRIIPKRYTGVPVSVDDAVWTSVHWNSREKVWELYTRGIDAKEEPLGFYNLLPALIVGLRIVNTYAPKFDREQWKSYQERLGKLKSLEPTASSLHSQAAFAADEYLDEEIAFMANDGVPTADIAKEIGLKLDFYRPDDPIDWRDEATWS